MKSLKEKLIDEKKDLDGKLSRLNTFLESKELSSEVDQTHKELLVEQSKIMTEYSHILRKRIFLLERE